MTICSDVTDPITSLAPSPKSSASIPVFAHGNFVDVINMGN